LSEAAVPAGGDAWSGGARPLGAHSKKFGMWLFIMSDSITFAGLLIAYSYARLSSAWPTPLPFDASSITLSTAMTFILLSSSLTMVLGVNRANQGDRKAAFKWIMLTALGGLGFVVLHSYEWLHIISHHQLFKEGSTLPMMWGTFFAITGMHMLHVTIGVGYLVVLGVQYVNGKFKAIDVEVLGLYWHFVDLVWMFVFPLLYLMSTNIEHVSGAGATGAVSALSLGFLGFFVLLAVLVAVWLGMFLGGAAGFGVACATLGKANRDIVANLRVLLGKSKATPGAHAEHAAHGMQENYVVWGVLLVLTLVEVALAYIHLPLLMMLVILMGLSLIKAALIVGYFMHMKFERLSFVLAIVPATVVIILLLNIFMPDGFRRNEFRELYDPPEPIPMEPKKSDAEHH